MRFLVALMLFLVAVVGLRCWQQSRDQDAIRDATIHRWMAHDSATVRLINASVARLRARTNWDSGIVASAGPHLPDPRPTLAEVTAAAISSDSSPLLFFGKVGQVLRLGGDSVQVLLGSLFYHGHTKLQVSCSDSVVPTWRRSSSLDNVGGVAVIALVDRVLLAEPDSVAPQFVLMGRCLVAHQLSFVQGLQLYWARWQEDGFHDYWRPSARRR